MEKEQEYTPVTQELVQEYMDNFRKGFYVDTQLGYPTAQRYGTNGYLERYQGGNWYSLLSRFVSRHEPKEMEWVKTKGVDID